MIDGNIIVIDNQLLHINYVESISKVDNDKSLNTYCSDGLKYCVCFKIRSKISSENYIIQRYVLNKEWYLTDEYKKLVQVNMLLTEYIAKYSNPKDVKIFKV